jgi:hypothetical protein
LSSAVIYSGAAFALDLLPFLLYLYVALCTDNMVFDETRCFDSIQASLAELTLLYSHAF